MNADFSHHSSLLKLLAIARRNGDSQALALADLETSRRDAAAALDRLEAAIRTEEAVALGRTEIGFRDFAGYLAGATAKRAAILASCRTLDEAIAGARARLKAAEIERKKLEHLVGLAAAGLKKRRDKREGAMLDDAGRRRNARRPQRA
ncbi:MAG: hypothetical protein U5J99_07335 [Parvularculaceae bacterium]|nr:hypothetical protein [Parvularculaceae bacterium]